MQVSIIEIYMEKIRDLLDPSRPQMKVRESKTRGVYIQGVTEVYVSSVQEVLRCLKIGTSHRTLEHTNMNETSSRSHMVFTLTLYQNNLIDMSARTAKLTLIDLAGSEKVSKSGVEGKLLD
jgi:kinesin family protein 5